LIDSFLRMAEDYERDHQDGQPFYTEIWVEAAGMMPQVARMVSEYDIPVYSSGGFNSTTAKYETARRIHRRDTPTRVLHIGDYDPSGVAIIDSLASDLNAFLEDLGSWSATTAHFVRLAITPPQIEALGLPGAPRKRTDNRAGFEDLTVQAEALSPPQLEALIIAEVEREWDADVYEELLETELGERDALVEALEGLSL
jgi:hypothetical protein